MPGHADAKSPRFLGEHLHLLRRHHLLGQRLQVLGAQRRQGERLQIAVDAQRRRTPDLEVQVGRAALDHLLQDALKLNGAEARRPAAD